MDAFRKQRGFVVLGASAVGKTALCQSFANDRFEESYDPTYENCFIKVFRYKGQDIECVIKDTQGLGEKEQFRNEYALGAHGYVLVYSIVNARSLRLLENVHRHLVSLMGTQQLPIVVVGTKLDLAQQGNRRQVTTAAGSALAKRWGCPFVECSAKTGSNIDAVFKAVVGEGDQGCRSDLRPIFGGTNCEDRCANCCFPSNSICCRICPGWVQSLCLCVRSTVNPYSSSSALSSSDGSHTAYSTFPSSIGGDVGTNEPLDHRIERGVRHSLRATLVVGVIGLLSGVTTLSLTHNKDSRDWAWSAAMFGLALTGCCAFGMRALTRRNSFHLRLYSGGLALLVLLQLLLWGWAVPAVSLTEPQQGPSSVPVSHDPQKLLGRGLATIWESHPSSAWIWPRFFFLTLSLAFALQVASVLLVCFFNTVVISEEQQDLSFEEPDSATEKNASGGLEDWI